MGIFRDITKSLKKAAPIIGAGIGMYFGGPMGASIGSGIGSLASGRSTEEALRNAALAGATTYAMGGADFGKGFEFSTAGSPFASTPTSIANAPTVTSVSTNPGMSDFATNSSIPKYTPSGETSMFDKALDFAKDNKMLTAAGVGTLLAAGSGGLGDEEVPQNDPMRGYPVGKSRLGTGRIGNKLYNLDDEDERKQYFEDNKKRQYAEDIESEQERERYSKRIGYMVGGEVNGAGTGTSDSVPARLSDGEFVVTAKAVRGAGGGDRDVGAARMYDMMSQLEGAA